MLSDPDILPIIKSIQYSRKGYVSLYGIVIRWRVSSSLGTLYGAVAVILTSSETAHAY